jgi:hypothetical protein
MFRYKFGSVRLDVLPGHWPEVSGGRCNAICFLEGSECGLCGRTEVLGLMSRGPRSCNTRDGACRYHGKAVVIQVLLESLHIRARQTKLEVSGKRSGVWCARNESK